MPRRHCLLTILICFSLPCAVLGGTVEPGEVPAPTTSEATDRQEAQAEPNQDRPLWPRTIELPGDITFRLRGRIETDAIWSTQSPANEAVFGDLGDVVGLRRVRIGAEGQLSDDHRYIAEIDLSSGEVQLTDLIIGCGKSTERWELRAGHFREPFSLEGQTSSRFFAFLERSPADMFDPARSWGLCLFRALEENDVTMALGAFHGGTDASDFEAGMGSTVAFTGRLTKAFINEDDGRQLLLCGISMSSRIPEQGTVRINQRPHSPLLEFGDSTISPFAPTIQIPADFQQLLNTQIAAARGPAWAHAEWYGCWIDQPAGPPVFYHGCYGSVGYFLTGEQRGYQSASGQLGPVRVARPWLRGPANRNRPHGLGAWEIVARFAYLDTVDDDAPPRPGGQPSGVHLPQPTFGLNWYLADRVRLMFNYTYSIPTEPTFGTSTANIFATRLAVYW